MGGLGFSTLCCVTFLPEEYGSMELTRVFGRLRMPLHPLRSAGRQLLKQGIPLPFASGGEEHLTVVILLQSVFDAHIHLTIRTFNR